MKRACYEWGWLLFTGAAVCCLGWWLATMISDRTVREINLDGERYLRIADGRVVFANVCGEHDRNRYLDGLVDFFEYPARSDPNCVDQSLKVPGLRYRRISWFGAPYEFAVELSLLIPGCVTAILGALFGFLFWRFRRAVRLAMKPLAP